MEIELLFEDGNVGNYTCCEVTQIILEDKKNREYWNYFTHIDFSDSFRKKTERIWLTDRPISINDRFKVLIFRQVLPAKKVVQSVDKAVESQQWEYGDDLARLDEVFVIDPRYVPETDPTGNRLSENTLVPLEQSLYGSNFAGNYYVVELFSSKRFLESVLSKKDKLNIQSIISSCHLQYDLINLVDRVGNILCKLHTEIVKHRILKITEYFGPKAPVLTMR